MTDERDRRKAVRLPVVIPVEYVGTDTLGKGTVINASPYGVLLQGDYLPLVGAYVSMRLFPPDKKEPLYIERAVVRWQTASDLGVEIITMAPEAHVRLTTILNLTLEKNGCMCQPRLPWLCRCLPVANMR